ncbi:MAG: type II toxin-antitoxin system ParD family antitoxin [Phycisphaeraceae bacterium]
MNLTLKPEFEKFVDEKIKSGQYASAAEVIENALTVLREHEQGDDEYLDHVRGEVAKGVEQLERGLTADFTAESVIKERRAAHARGN